MKKEHIKRETLINHIDNLLETQKFKDYAPNGLQVEGRDSIQKIMLSVTASQAAIDAAIKSGADTLLVHHGLFWKNEIPTITSWKKNRIHALLSHNINLIGYHLPLDAHPTLGNNAQLAERMHWTPLKQISEQGLLFIGNTQKECTLESLEKDLTRSLNRTPTVIGPKNKIIKTLAWCTGGAQGFFQEAINEGVDAFVTGEISEPQFHLAQECQTAFISAGHHATERYGIKALGKHLQETFGLEIDFLDENNPA